MVIQLKSEKLVKSSNVVLLIISVVFLLISIFVGGGIEDFVPTELCSMIVLYYSIVFILNKKDKNFISKLGVIESIIMILFILLDKSLFILIYFLLGLLYLVENIKYIIDLKKNEYKEQSKNNKFVLIFLPFIVPIVFFIYGIANTKKSVKNLDAINSKEDLISSVEIVEKSINNAISNSANAYKLEIKFNQKKIDTTKLITLETLKKNNYKCDAYTNLVWNRNADESYYNYIISIEGSKNKDSVEYHKYHNVSLENFYTGKTYVSCKGKYSYKTKDYEK